MLLLIDKMRIMDKVDQASFCDPPKRDSQRSDHIRLWLRMLEIQSFQVVPLVAGEEGFAVSRGP